MNNPSFDFSNRYTIAFSLLALMAVIGIVLLTRYVRWRRAEHRRRYGIGPRQPRR